MSHELKEGARVSYIGAREDEWNLSIEYHQVQSMVISMQVGDMAMVPWVKVTFKDGDVGLYNVRHLQTVMLEKADDQSH